MRRGETTVRKRKIEEALLSPERKKKAGEGEERREEREKKPKNELSKRGEETKEWFFCLLVCSPSFCDICIYTPIYFCDFD